MVEGGVVVEELLSLQDCLAEVLSLVEEKTFCTHGKTHGWEFSSR